MAEGRQALIGTMAVLAATVATLFGVALLDEADPAEPAAAPPGLDAPEPDSDRLLDLAGAGTPAVARRVEAIREHEFRRLPEPQLGDAERLRELAERELARPRLQRQLRVAEAELRLLGLLASEDELDEVAGDVTALAIAYYDPRRGRLFLIGDAVPAGPALAELVLSHELTHALEDQRFGLPESGGLSDDRALAETALVEGSATVAMDRYAARHLDPFALAAESAAIDAGAAGELPRFAEAEVTFAYLEGARFVEELLGLGSGWALVDYAYERRPPATTEQVIHPAKYIDGEPALPVPPAPAPSRGWRPLDAGSLGEFGTREVLRAGEPGLAADVGAAGWGGDRYRLFARRGAPPSCAEECRSTHALAVRWRMDTARDARQLGLALGRYARLGLHGRAAGPSVWHLDDGWAAIDARGGRVGLGLAPSRAGAAALAAGR